jgi:hypothetical protein
MNPWEAVIDFIDCEMHLLRGSCATPEEALQRVRRFADGMNTTQEAENKETQKEGAD